MGLGTELRSSSWSGELFTSPGVPSPHLPSLTLPVFTLGTLLGTPKIRTARRPASTKGLSMSSSWFTPYLGKAKAAEALGEQVSCPGLRAFLLALWKHTC